MQIIKPAVMEEAVFFILFIVLILVVVFQLVTSAKLGKISNELSRVKKMISEIQIPKTIVVEKVKETPPVIVPQKEEVIPIVKEEKTEEKIIPEEPVLIPEEEPIIVPPANPLSEIKRVVTSGITSEKTAQKTEKEKKSFFKKNPDLEKFIGENLISKIGIGILVLGLIFFVKYAIDNNWINEIGRVGIGILSGGLLIGLAHRLRKNFKAFSSVLVGGGIAVLYATFAIAFHEYQLFSQAVTFVIMIIITLFAVFLSIAYDRQELAIIAMLGGFGTPFFVSTGEGNYIVLFSYLLILNVGMMVLSYFKNWYWTHFISFVFTLLIFAGWLTAKYPYMKPVPHLGAIIFATLFYLIFFAMNIINNIREKRKFKFTEIFILLSNSFAFFSAGLFILFDVQNARYQGIFTALVGMFNLAFALFLYKNNKVDRNLIYFLIGLVLTFASLTAPIQLEGNYITIFWATEAVLLLWLSSRTGIAIIRWATLPVLLLMLFSLFMDWEKVYIDTSYYYLFTDNPEKIILPAPFMNKGFITGIYSSAALALYTFLLVGDKKNNFRGFNTNVVSVITTSVLIVIFYLANVIEISYQADVFYKYGPAVATVTGAFTFVYVFLLNLWAYIRKVKLIHPILTGISLFLILLYITYYQNEFINHRDTYLNPEEMSVDFTGVIASQEFVSTFSVVCHYFLIAGLIGLTFIYGKSVHRFWGPQSILHRLNLWLLTFIGIFMLSAELDNIVIMAVNPAIENFWYVISQSHKIGFPILWGLSSFVLMAIGMRMKVRNLRIISLSLIFITILKLFIYDIRGINEGGKIAAFISLGILLLIVSFMYQKLKKLILDKDEEEKQKMNNLLSETSHTENHEN